MKIIKLTAANYKRLRAVEITPDGNTVVVSGRNGQGKSSILDAIFAALGGAAGSKEVQRPIRDGASKAEVSLDLGDLRVTRTWSATGSALRVENGDGEPVRSPQALLDSLCGRYMFDPLAFAEARPKDQVAALLELVDLPFKPDELAAERQAIFDERTVVGRKVRDLEGQVKALPEPDETVPEDEISVSDVADELAAGSKANDVLQAACRAVEEASARVVQVQGDIERIEAELELARKRGEAAGLAYDEAVAELDKVEDPPDLDEIRGRLAAAEATNTAVRANNRRLAVEADLVATKAEVDALTAQIVELDRRREKGLSEAAMPVEGLSFDDDGVTFNGIPFSQCSGAERLRVSMAIAMAGNPGIRIARVTDGSLLDSDGLLLVAEMAAEHDVQVWIEKVTDGESGVGVVIEDGMVSQ